MALCFFQYGNMKAWAGASPTSGGPGKTYQWISQALQGRHTLCPNVWPTSSSVRRTAYLWRNDMPGTDFGYGGLLPPLQGGPGVWTFLTPCLSVNGAANASLGQRPRSGPEQCQRAESPPHGHHQASIPVHDESRFQRSEWSLADKPRALPWAGMNDAVGVLNRPTVPAGCCLSGNLVVRPVAELI